METTEITITVTVPSKTIRKMKGYAVMTGQNPSTFVDQLSYQILGDQLNKVVDSLIAGELETLSDVPRPVHQKNGWQDHVSSTLDDDSDLTGELIEDDEIGGPGELKQAATKVIPQITDDDLEHDLDVEEPEEEAAAQAVPSQAEEKKKDPYAVGKGQRETVRKQNEAADVESMAAIMGIDMSGVEPRKVGRYNPKPKLGRGKVEGFDGIERNQF